jgi:hypothetical protein
MKQRRTTTSNRNNFVIAFALIASAMVLISLAVTIVFVKRYDKLEKDFNSYKTGYSIKLWSVNDEIVTPKFILKINGLSIDKTGIPQYLPAPEGMDYVSVDLNVKNRTANDEIFIVQDHVYLRDELGNRYNPTVAPNVEKGIAGSIAAGDTAKGQIGFLIPESSQDLKFYFVPYGIEPADTVVIDLKQ